MISETDYFDKGFKPILKISYSSQFSLEVLLYHQCDKFDILSESIGAIW